MDTRQLDELTTETYVCPKGEETMYHVVQEVKQFDPKTGRRISAPRLQKYGRKGFEGSTYATLLKQGYEVRIVHDPKAFIEAEAKQMAETRKMRAEALAKAEAEKKQAEKDALKAEILAELKASGMLATPAEPLAEAEPAEKKKAGRPKKEE